MKINHEEESDLAKKRTDAGTHFSRTLEWLLLCTGVTCALRTLQGPVLCTMLKRTFPNTVQGHFQAQNSKRTASREESCEVLPRSALHYTTVRWGRYLSWAQVV